MNKLIMVLIFFLLIITGSKLSALSSAEIDKAAPEFALTDSYSKTYKLSDYKGKFVVLEWMNFHCPFVKKHYKSGNMQNLQKEYTAKGVVWLSICSSAPGKEGNFSTDQINQQLKEYNASQTAYLIDEDGTVGKMYGAKTTPDMYIINKEGILIYTGAIDDIRSTDVDDIPKAKNFVKEALDNALNGNPIVTKITKSYGCSVKYNQN